MRIILAIFFILLLASTAVAHTPIGMQRWQISDTTGFIQYGGTPQNYLNGSAWNPIENDFHVNGSGIFESSNRLLKTFVDSLGDVIITFTHDSTDYTAIQQPHSLKFFRKTDSAWIDIDNTPNFNNISHDGNTIRWGNMFPGVNYKVILNNGRVENRYEFKPALLDSAVILLDQRPDSADIYLANVMKFTLSASIDGYDVPLGNIRKRVLKRFGSLVFQIGKTTLRGFPGADTMNIPVWQRHIFVGSQLYVLEFVKMSAIKQIHEAYPTATLWHNASFTLDNDTDIIDSFIKKNNADVNYGTTSKDFLYNAGNNFYKFLTTFQNLNDSLGAGVTIDTAIYNWVNGNAVASDRYIFWYGMWNPYWIEVDTGSGEGGVTWNDWSSPDSEFTTAGAECAFDAGAFNSWDDAGCAADSADKQSTYLDSLTIPNGAADPDTFAAYITAWIDTCYQNDENPSIMAETKGNLGIYIYTRESSTYKPWLVVYYTEAGEPAEYLMRRRHTQQKLLGEK